jgi:hypothetical protein
MTQQRWVGLTIRKYENNGKDRSDTNEAYPDLLQALNLSDGYSNKQTTLNN